MSYWNLLVIAAGVVVFSVLLYLPLRWRKARRALTTEIGARLQCIEREQRELRSMREGDRQVQILSANIAGAAQATPIIGAAIERFLHSGA
jgi:hypothetical protein